MSKHPFYLLDLWGTIRTDAPEEWLGRVVADHVNPKASYAPENAKVIAGNKMDDDSGYIDVSELINSKKGSSMYGLLADVLKFSADDSHSTSPSINAPRVEQLSIGQHPEVFSRLIGDPSAKAAVDKLTWEKRKAYLIVGLLVTDQIAFTESSSSLSDTSLQAKLPTKEIAAAAGAPGVDVPLQGGIDDSQESSRQGSAGLHGRRIFAIQYRLLRKHRTLPVIGRRDTELDKKTLSGDRFFGDQESVEAGEAALDMVLEEDVSLEDEIEDGDERLVEL